MTILDSVLRLLELPRTPNADPTRPSESDAAEFRQTIVQFKPNDYDMAIEERHSNGSCGYALCPRPAKKVKGGGKFAFVETASDLHIMPRKIAELWCSQDCAKRAMYVKVQLGETLPALRKVDDIELMIEKTEAGQSITLPFRPRNQGSAQRANASEQSTAQSSGVNRVTDGILKMDIVEKQFSSANPQPPTLGDQQSQESYASVEGYQPRASKDKAPEMGERDWL